MALIYNSIIVIAVIFAIAYTILMALYCYGWIKTPVNHTHKITNHTKVCVVIPARNESKNIETCILSVLTQDYPHSMMEIIVVDDCSEDNTNQIIQKISDTDKRIKLITLHADNPQNFGKKVAIQEAVNATDAELIVTTDADCIMKKSWLASIVSFYKQTSAKMICGPIMFRTTNGILEKMQQLESMALVASGAASLFYNKATLCNGANLAYEKQAFIDVGGFSGINAAPSGDDVLLMYKIKKRYNGGVLFLKNKDAMVYTNPVATIKAFFEQRKRWVSKDFSLLNTETQISSLIIGGFNIALCIFFAAGCVFSKTVYDEYNGLIIFYLLLVIKCIFDFLLLFLASLFVDTKQLLKYFLLQELLYSPYVFVVWLKAMRKKYEWKGRIYR